MKMKVYHHQMEQGPGQGLELVAQIEVPATEGDGLEFAYRLTQNIEGSWSRGAYIDGVRNPDHHPAVTRIAPLHVHDGKEYGLRSSMVGDVFETDDGARWIVADMGFKPVVPA